MRIWQALRGLMGRRTRDWQPVIACCVRCRTEILQRAAYCASCGVAQQPETIVLPQTEAIQKLPTRQTEALKVPTSEIETRQMYVVRMGERHPAQQRLAEKRLYRWLYEQIYELYRDGATLVADSHTYGCHQYLWLRGKLEQREGSLQLIKTFTGKCEKENVIPFGVIESRKADASYGRSTGA